MTALRRKGSVPRALIIGGGLAGLGAALFLRRLGHETLLLERSERLGSLVRGFRRGGLAFETGFHYAGGLGEGGVLRRYLDVLGLLKTGLTPVPLPDPGGETLRLGQGPDILIPHGKAPFQKLFPAAPALEAFFAESAALTAASPFLNPAARPLNFTESLLSRPTVAEKIEALDLPDRLKALLAFRCLLLGSAPAKTDWADFARVNEPFMEGTHTFEGGGEALAGAFETALAQAGVEVKAGRQVVAVETDPGGAFRGLVSRAVAGGGEELETGDLCVYSGNPGALPELLPAGSLRPLLRRRLSDLKPTPRPFMVFASTGTDFFERRQFFSAPDPRLENWLTPESGFFYLSGGPGQGGRRPVVIATLAPETAGLAWRNAPAWPRPPEYIEFKRKLAATVIRRVLARCPEFNGDLELLDCATDLTLSRYCFAQSGGLYGRRREPGAPPLAPRTRIKGLALAGQDIVLPGLLGTLASAALAVGVLAGPEKIWEILA